jgi:D-lactate dehydrogenase (cytochrome)
MPKFTPVNKDHIVELTAIVGAENLSTAQADLDQHASDQSQHAAQRSEVVVWPTDAQQVADVLKFASGQRIAVTPWGAGTSLEGNPIPLYGGILLSCARMSQIVGVHADDFQVTVQPGVGYKDLNEALRRYGLFFPPDPGANASVGGMLANNAAGIRTVKYGASKDNVVGMQVALADGRLIEVGSRAIKQSSGYDLLHLFVGSEGTLGVITEATLQLAPIAQRMSVVVAAFETVEAAIRAVVAIRGSGLDLAALEFIDAPSAELLSGEEGVDLGSQHTLFMEFHAAHQETLELGLETVREICDGIGAVSVRATADPAERKRLWRARHSALEILMRANPGHRFIILDVAVPISTYPELVAHIQTAMREQVVTGHLVGHAGDGNMHVLLPYPDEDTYQKGMAVNGAVIRGALELGGTTTGEHGVGMGKRAYMRQEHGSALDVMLALKQTLDPVGILNPGKLFPEE